MPSTERLLEVAAASTLARIRRDRGRAIAKHHLVEPLFDYLESHLFDPNLNADQLIRACGFRSTSAVSKCFRAATPVCLAPYGYIEDCRLEVANWLLLLSSDLPLKKIARLIGYSSSSVFSEAFVRWSGLRPAVYRPHNSTSRRTQS